MKSSGANEPVTAAVASGDALSERPSLPVHPLLTASSRRDHWLRVLRAGARRGAPPSAWRPAGHAPAGGERSHRSDEGSAAELDAIIQAARTQLNLLFRSYRPAQTARVPTR